jgi:hypothetical protein
LTFRAEAAFVVFPQFESIYEKIYQAADLDGLAALLTEIRDQYGLARAPRLPRDPSAIHRRSKSDIVAHL